MKKILSVLLAAAMLMSFSVCAFAEEPVTATPRTEGNADTGLGAAIAAAPENGGTVVVKGEGDFGGAVVNGDDKNLTIKVEGEVVISNPSVGSAGTTTLGIQVLKESEKLTIVGEGEGAKITFDGKSTDDKDESGNVRLKRGIQEYTDLTLDNVIIDGTDLSNHEGSDNVYNSEYLNTTISVCAGDLVIDNNAGVLAAEGDNAISVSLYETGGYSDVPTLTVTTDAGTIQGTIVVDGSYKAGTEVTADNSAKVNIEGGNFINFLLKIGEAVANYAKENISITGGTFDSKDVDGKDSDGNAFTFEQFVATTHVVVEQDGKYVVMTKEAAEALNKQDDIVAVIPPVTYAPTVYEAPAGNATVEVNGEEVSIKLDSTVVSASAAPVALADETPVVVKVNVSHTALSANVFTAIEMVQNLSETLEIKGADGAVIEAGQYEVAFDGYGQIQIKLSPELMQKLGVGTHTLTINLGGYEIEVTIVIN